MLADCNRVIFLNIRVISIMQKLRNVFYKNNFCMYLVILRDFDNLKLGKIQEFLFSNYGCSLKIEN